MGRVPESMSWIKDPSSELGKWKRVYCYKLQKGEGLGGTGWMPVSGCCGWGIVTVTTLVCTLSLVFLRSLHLTICMCVKIHRVLIFLFPLKNPWLDTVAVSLPTDAACPTVCFQHSFCFRFGFSALAVFPISIKLLILCLQLDSEKSNPLKGGHIMLE